ncbi:DKNYY domain-containing protein [Thalassolituus marinus]|uniref:DKNYY domain-containing protein n=1 Tax=Thalassolituus marinus TaxID=671053 RepID=A0ABS7ZSK4_9GAMM|nr:DKNYY domain-containing protein [Thalassolituus marinus]MCA6064751.1 DKNYY domain-containing protein [Thalassolituus marinus]
MMKICGRCDFEEESEELLVCRNCKRAFHDRNDSWLVLFLAIAFTVVAYVLRDQFFYSVMYVLWSASSMLLYMILKLFQKWRSPERNVVKEAAYVLPYSMLGSSVYILSIAGALVLYYDKYLFLQPESGLDGLMSKPEILEIGCYLLAFIYLIFVLAFHKGMIFTTDSFYRRIVSNEYERITDFRVLARSLGGRYKLYLKNISVEVDKETFHSAFETLGFTYFMDKDQIFFIEHTHAERAGVIIPELDISTFKLLTEDPERKSHVFAIDRDRVYYLMGRYSKALNDVDVKTVRVLEHGYLTDGKSVYQGPDRIELDLDIETLEVLSHNYVRDSQGVYLISGIKQIRLDVVDPESFEAIDYKTFKDKSGVYKIDNSQIRRMEADETI